MSQRSVLVTGANGYIGSAVCRAFVQAGWTVYGLVRKPEAALVLAAEEVIPIQGSIGDNAVVFDILKRQKTFNAIVSTTEIVGHFESHIRDIVSVLLEVSKESNQNGVRPLVLFTSGCKDYGMTGRADSPDLSPHTEISPLNPPAAIAGRCFASLRIFQYTDFFDAVLIRPTTIFGRSGGYYGPFFELAQHAKDTNTPLVLPSYSTSILHGTHVDDCGYAYVAIAEHDRSQVAGQCYNVSSRRFETLEEIAEALVKEYSLEQGVIYDPPQNKPGDEFDVVQLLTGFSQWVGSDKLRKETGWNDRRPLFRDGLKVYRLSYEAAAKYGHSNVARVKSYMDKSTASH